MNGITPEDDVIQNTCVSCSKYIPGTYVRVFCVCRVFLLCVPPRVCVLFCAPWMVDV